MSRFSSSCSRALLALSAVAALAVGSAGASLAGTAKHQAPRDQAHYEAWLQNEVRHQLVMLPWLTIFDNLEYRVEGTKVILSGQVTRPTLKMILLAR